VIAPTPHDDEPVTTRVLMTCFDAFGGQAINASARAVAAVDASRLPAGVELLRVELPTVFGRSLDKLRSELDRHRPEIVICVGQAETRAGFSLERVAVNLDDARIPDNAGRAPQREPIVAGAASHLDSTLPLGTILLALERVGIPAELSDSAGSFVCNHVFYGLMQLLSERPGVCGGFVHIPRLPQQLPTTHSKGEGPGAEISLDLETQARGLETLIQACLR